MIEEGQEPEPERCVYCKAPIQYGWPTKGEWAHVSGARYCQDIRGYTATPLQVATPTYHPDGGVL